MGFSKKENRALVLLDSQLVKCASVQNTDVRKTANFRDVKAFRLRVRNQRKAVDESQSEPAFKSFLFKLNQDGDALNAEHWLKREMWIAKNGSLCYFSKKENRILMYQNAEDLRDATLRVLTPTESAQTFA